jgi:dTDP-4-amino-4,6-dideoxygalactose transaminase
MSVRQVNPAMPGNTERKRIPVSQPMLDGREREYVMEALASGWLISQGGFVTAFERTFAEYCGVRHAVAVCRGTAALHLCLVAHGVGPGDEVIVPTLTYIATANAVRDLPKTQTWAEHVYWMFTILLGACVSKDRDAVMADLDRQGIETRPVFYPIHTMPPYRKQAAGEFPNAQRCASRGINLPTYAGLSEADLDHICMTLEASLS